MKNETKRDVFDDVLAYVPVGREYDPLNDDEAGDLRSLLSERYSAALPDDLPVIPKDIAYVIEQAKKGDYKLGWVFNAAYLGIWRVSVGNWIRTHSETVARAWLDGYQVEGHK